LGRRECMGRTRGRGDCKKGILKSGGGKHGWGRRG